MTWVVLTLASRARALCQSLQSRLAREKWVAEWKVDVVASVRCDEPRIKPLAVNDAVVRAGQGDDNAVVHKSDLDCEVVVVFACPCLMITVALGA